MRLFGSDRIVKVMDRMGYARGLIRYATLNGLSQSLSKAQMRRRALCVAAAFVDARARKTL